MRTNFNLLSEQNNINANGDSLLNFLGIILAIILIIFIYIFYVKIKFSFLMKKIAKKQEYITVNGKTVETTKKYKTPYLLGKRKLDLNYSEAQKKYKKWNKLFVRFGIFVMLFLIIMFIIIFVKVSI